MFTEFKVCGKMTPHKPQLESDFSYSHGIPLLSSGKKLVFWATDISIRQRAGNMTPLQLLQRLPEELLQDVIERLNKQDLYSFNLLSRWCHQVATPIIWREVELVDCRTRHENHEDAVDEHDDTPLIKKLLILAKYVLAKRRANSRSWKSF